MNLIDRCSFYDRCAYKDTGICSLREPHLVKVGGDHYAACYKPWEEQKTEYGEEEAQCLKQS
jgi:peptide/nickel transport system ATP-binding protein